MEGVIILGIGITRDLGISALLLCDMAHISGRVAAQEAADPFEYCDLVTTTTHKSLRGPRAGMIFYKKGIKPARMGQPEDAVYDFEDKINFVVFPSFQGGPQSPKWCSCRGFETGYVSKFQGIC